MSVAKRKRRKADRPKRRWSAGVKTVSTFPPPGLFKKKPPPSPNLSPQRESLPKARSPACACSTISSVAPGKTSAVRAAPNSSAPKDCSQIAFGRKTNRVLGASHNPRRNAIIKRVGLRPAVHAVITKETKEHESILEEVSHHRLNSDFCLRRPGLRQGQRQRRQYLFDSHRIQRSPSIHPGRLCRPA